MRNTHEKVLTKMSLLYRDKRAYLANEFSKNKMKSKYFDIFFSNNSITF